MVLMAFAGGLGTLAGPVLGALLIEPAHEYLAIKQSEPGLYLVLYGAVFLVIILLLPRGIIPTIQGWLSQRAARQRRAETERAQATKPAPGGEPIAVGSKEAAKR
jgi:branched-chain amino acid transport system permease protein